MLHSNSCIIRLPDCWKIDAAGATNFGAVDDDAFPFRGGAAFALQVQYFGISSRINTLLFIAAEDWPFRMPHHEVLQIICGFFYTSLDGQCDK